MRLAKEALTRSLKEGDEAEVKMSWKSVALANVSGFFGGGEGGLEKALRGFDLGEGITHRRECESDLRRTHSQRIRRTAATQRLPRF